MMQFVQEKMQGISRNKAKSILTGQGITVNNQIITRFDHLLKVGEKVKISKHKRSQELKNQFVKMVYEDRWIMVIEKNVGVLSMGNSSNTFCVKTILDDYLKKKHLKCTAHVVHRLDRDTSGLMIYAKTQEAQDILEENWHDIVTDRRYIAVVYGAMEENSGSIESWLKDNKAFVTYSSPQDNGGKYALTYYRTIKVGQEFSLVELKLDTGRKNQIRVHMSDLSHPVVGDVKYGMGSSPIGRLALHAFRLNFYHPITNEMLTFETPYPKPFIHLVR
ncbi:MAG: RluA family pseudouridine synthase [Bacteroidaceae bacterium]